MELQGPLVGPDAIWWIRLQAAYTGLQAAYTGLQGCLRIISGGQKPRVPDLPLMVPPTGTACAMPRSVSLT